MRRRAAAPVALALLALVAGGCVNYPTIMEVGGPRILPAKGRVILDGDGARVFVVLSSTGKFGDVLTGVTSPVADEARLVGPNGAPLGRLRIPGASTISFGPGATHIVLSALKRPLVPGETIIVTLLFEKSGGIGIVAVVE